MYIYIYIYIYIYTFIYNVSFKCDFRFEGKKYLGFIRKPLKMNKYFEYLIL